ncbi:MAG: protein kinase [Geothrix sp.]|uniref:protein kinase domain-containing protein n=1 Tax=Geothrix sp. TaxID=1962974 RepID=UPI001856901A|nr:protein kinase [Geothrix sp.]NWJ40428.1 protein kinase [Geothrix sp.]WIL21565.1 MAG: protein kinase [Geothrix sp.]
MRDRLGKFEVVRLLGKGAMGEVYLGRDPKLGRDVALKVISAGTAFGDEAQARFEREARAAALLNHPHVVTIYEFGEDEGMHYLAMEFLDGHELEALIREGKTPKADLLEVLAQVCDGLGYAHGRSVIHRDIKPANVLVTRQGKRLHAKLMDFGVAHMGPSGLTQSGVWMGTVSYMAPEYLDTGRATASSDIFALGVILYEILSGGRKPFHGESTTSVLNCILRHAPEPIRPADLKDVPGRLIAVVDRALAKRPEDRYPDAESLGGAIREGLSGPVEAPMAAAVPAPAPVRPEPEGSGHRIRVGKGGQGQCLSLKVALRQAKAGSEILVLPGVYRESLVVDKDVAILALGEPGEVIIQASSGPALIIQTQAVTLRGLTLQGPAGEAVLKVKSGSARVEGGRILGFQDAGVEVDSGAQVSLEEVVIGPGAGTALRVGGRGQATLVGSTLQGEAGGVEVEGEGRVQLTGCRLVDSRFAGLLALEHSQVVAESSDIGNHACAGVHVLAGANVVLRQCRVAGNAGFGVSVMDRGLATMEGCQVQANGGAGLLIHRGATVQARNCAFSEGRSLGVDCAEGGQGVLDACEIAGNAGAGVQVEPGGSLLLVRCSLNEGRDTGLLLMEDSDVTLEECVVRRNARGGVLLARDAADPVMRGGNRIEDGFHRVDAGGNLVKVTPI